MTIATCSYNGCALTTAEELESPHTVDGDVFCDECYDSWRSDNESVCPFCCDYFLDDELSECFVFLGDEFDEHEPEPGLYRPLVYPYYDQPMLGRPRFRDVAIEQIGSLLFPDRMETANCPAAYVCTSCMGETTEERLPAK